MTEEVAVHWPWQRSTARTSQLPHRARRRNKISERKKLRPPWAHSTQYYRETPKPGMPLGFVITNRPYPAADEPLERQFCDPVAGAPSQVDDFDLPVANPSTNRLHVDTKPLSDFIECQEFLGCHNLGPGSRRGGKRRLLQYSMSRGVRTHPSTSVVVHQISRIATVRQLALHVVSSIDKDCIGVLI